MRRSTTLKKAIEIASKNGWKNDKYLGDAWFDLTKEDQKLAINIFIREDFYKLFIYDNDFNKALWPNRDEDLWSRQLKMMAISPDAITWLGENL